MNFDTKILKEAISFALEETMERFASAEDDGYKFVYSVLERSRAMWEKIRIGGLRNCGMSNEQFYEQLENKRNVIFLSDDEMERFNKAIQIMSVLNE